jgi:hypothetical protein
MVTVAEDIKEKIARAEAWEEANPGRSWCEVVHPENEPKIYITKELIRSPAYRSLSRVAMLVYQDFLVKRIMKHANRNKRKVWVIENNGEIVYPYSEAVRKGFSRDQFRNAIDELQIKGFIDIKHLGKGGRKPSCGTGDFTKYFIDNRWCDFDEDNKRSRRSPRNPRKKDNRRGRGWALYHEKNTRD